MFGKNFTGNLFQSRRAAGVECVILPDGIMSFRITCLKKKKSQLFSEYSEPGIESIGLLKTKIKTDVPLCLVVNGKGIIHRKVAVTETDNDISLLQKVMPNANRDDFYMQKTCISENSFFISVIRKSVADELLSEFSKCGFTVAAFSLGPFCIHSILPLMEEFQNKSFDITLRDQKISVRENRVENLQPQEQNPSFGQFLIGKESIDSELLLSFASAIGYFAGNDTGITIPSVSEGREELRQKKIFTAAGISMAALFISVIATGVFLSRHFASNRDALNERIYLSRDKIQRYDSLKNMLEAKQNFFIQTGLLESSRSSWYADQIAKDIPETIRLTELTVNPVERKINMGEEKISFVPDRIRISGNCSKSTQLNAWIAQIKKKIWVKRVELLNFSQDKIQEEGSFSLELSL